MDSMQLLQISDAVRKLTKLSESDSERNEPSPNVTSNYRRATDAELFHFRHQITRYNEVVVILFFWFIVVGGGKSITFKYCGPLLVLGLSHG
jgi:hypothetical protein